MVTVIVLAKVKRGAVNETAERLVELDGVTEVYSVAGNYDLVIMVRVRDNETMAQLVTQQMVTIEAIDSTHTMLAFKAFSRHDLESLFAIGFDEED